MWSAAMSENRMFPSQTLTQGAITLRPLRGSDASLIAVAGNDFEIQKWLPLPTPYTLAEASRFIEEISIATLAAGTGNAQSMGASSARLQ